MRSVRLRSGGRPAHRSGGDLAIEARPSARARPRRRAAPGSRGRGFGAAPSVADELVRRREAAGARLDAGQRPQRERIVGGGQRGAVALLGAPRIRAARRGSAIEPGAQRGAPAASAGSACGASLRRARSTAARRSSRPWQALRDDQDDLAAEHRGELARACADGPRIIDHEAVSATTQRAPSSGTAAAGSRRATCAGVEADDHRVGAGCAESSLSISSSAICSSGAARVGRAGAGQVVQIGDPAAGQRGAAADRLDRWSRVVRDLGRRAGSAR